VGVFQCDPPVEGQVQPHFLAKHLIDVLRRLAQHAFVEVVGRLQAEPGESDHKRFVVQRLAVDQRSIHVPEDGLWQHRSVPGLLC
jgi:hypothetical protein